MDLYKWIRDNRTDLVIHFFYNDYVYSINKYYPKVFWFEDSEFIIRNTHNQSDEFNFKRSSYFQICTAHLSY